MSVSNYKRSFVSVALLAAALALSGCSSSIVDMPGMGSPSDAAAHPKEPDAYLPVHDIPPDRDAAVIPPAERQKIEAELIAARDRQAIAAAQGAAAQNPSGQNSSAK